MNSLYSVFRLSAAVFLLWMKRRNSFILFFQHRMEKRSLHFICLMTTPGNIQQVLSHWQDKKNYIDHWDEAAFTEFADILVKQGALTSPEQYLNTIPHGGFYLHFLPFLQGMLYVGNTTQLNEDEIKLIQSVADAFSTAYARYEDFNKLEAAKQQVDNTLIESETGADTIDSIRKNGFAG